MVHVIILAGQRKGLKDTLCLNAGVSHKALVPINGTPMIDYVIKTLLKSNLNKPFGVSGFDADHHKYLEDLPSDDGPAGSALIALTKRNEFPTLLTTCDHPLLSTDMLKIFVEKAQQNGADFCMAFAEKSVIQSSYPTVKRTYWNFSDISVSGCNLFYIANPKGLAIFEYWKKVQHLRKNPIKLAINISWFLLIKYLLGRLELKEAFNHISIKLNLSAKAVIIPIAEAAIDVDKPADKDLVEEILKRPKYAS
jgi:CTP:molybdopterin cytidylyltransferase MocA